MSRPGAWTRVAQNFFKYIRNDFSKKVYVGEDVQGHRFYEIVNSRQNVARGFDPPTGASSSQPGIEWQAWLRGTRRFPPSEAEIAMNNAKQQAQLADNAATENRAPHVQSEGRGSGDHGPAPFPKYEDLETNPGARAEHSEANPANKRGV